MKKYISFSGGVESSAMCVLFGKHSDAIFADTGWEHKEIYDRIILVEERVREIHKNNFTVHRIKGTMKYKGKEYDKLQDYISASKFYPSTIARFCTRAFKVEPIDNFLKDKGDVEILIGLNYDEKDRTGNHGLMENVTYSYPLIDNKVTREACLAILDKAGLRPKFPPYMARGGCVGCFYKSKKEFYAMAQLSKDEFKEVEDLEKGIQDKRGSYYSVRINIPSMAELRKLAETSMFDAKDMYDMEMPQTSCGVFCNR